MYFVSLNTSQSADNEINCTVHSEASLQDLGKIQILGLSNLVFTRSETKLGLFSTLATQQDSQPVDWNIIINDGILMTRGVHPQHYSLLLLKHNDL